MSDRPTFDEVYMQFAATIARRSTCTRLAVGTVITTTDYRKVLAVGYNGNASGLANTCDREEPGNCGCAAGMARPGVRLALANVARPDRLGTVFAGQDVEATARARGAFPEIPPSSPSMALFKDGELVYFVAAREAAQAMKDTFVPVDHAVVGIVNDIQIDDDPPGAGGGT